MKLKKSVDYHIKELGTWLELSSTTLAGFAAGIIYLVKNGYEVNHGSIRSIGVLLIAQTMPNVIDEPAAKPKKPKKSTKKVVGKK